jgi:large subunit ribosomal protein L21
MVSYAIVQASGKQFWIEEDRFYDFDKLPLNPGDNFKLNKVLLVNKEGSTQIGKPFLSDNCLIEATVVRHLSGSKIRVYKMRPKKKTRKTFGSRSKMTRVLIRSINTSA